MSMDNIKSHNIQQMGTTKRSISIQRTYPPHNNLTNINIPTLPEFTTTTTLKFSPQYSYYTDGSFVPPKQARDRHWKKEKT